MLKIMLIVAMILSFETIQGDESRSYPWKSWESSCEKSLHLIPENQDSAIFVNGKVVSDKDLKKQLPKGKVLTETEYAKILAKVAGVPFRNLKIQELKRSCSRIINAYRKIPLDMENLPENAGFFSPPEKSK